MKRCLSSVAQLFRCVALSATLALITLPLHAAPKQTQIGRNRYGMVLQRDDKGEVSLKREKQLRYVLPNFDELTDLITIHKYRPDKIKAADYSKCTTVTKIYKQAVNGADLRIEIDLPTDTTSPTPFVVWIHGGGWKDGGPQAFTKESQFAASRNIAGVRIQYLLRPASPIVDNQITDIADAVKYIQANAKELNIDPTRYAFVGGSAGAHLATMSAINDSKAKAFVGLYGVYDVKGFFDFLDIFSTPRAEAQAERVSFFHIGDKENYERVNPTTAMRKNLPPALIIHGTGDSTVPYAQCVTFVDKMQALNNDVEFITCENYEHNFTGQNGSDLYEELLLKTFNFLADKLNLAD